MNVEIKPYAALPGTHVATLSGVETTPGATIELFRKSPEGVYDFTAPIGTATPDSTGAYTYQDKGQVVEGETVYYSAVAVVKGLRSVPTEASAVVPTLPASPSLSVTIS